MMSQDADRSGDHRVAARLAEAVASAKRGFRRDTEALVSLLDEGVLLMALAVPADEDAAEELVLSPKLVTTDSGEVLLPAFTSPERLREFAAELEWTTRGDELSYCSLSVRGVFDAALDLFQNEHCDALVIDPADEQELLLQPRELDALRQGQPVPLVGYVKDLPLGADETSVVAALETPPSPKLLTALAACLAEFPNVQAHRLEQTMNRERDFEPHPTLTLSLSRDTSQREQEALRQRLYAMFEEELPAPGYIDVVFEPVGEAP